MQPQSHIEVNLPQWMFDEAEKRTGSLTIEQLVLAAAILGWEKLKAMTAEQIIAVLEEATLR